MKINHGKIFTFNIFGYKCYKDALEGNVERDAYDVPIVAGNLDDAKEGIMKEALKAKGKKWELCHFTFYPTTDRDDVTIVHIPELEKKVIAPDLPNTTEIDNGDED